MGDAPDRTATRRLAGAEEAAFVARVERHRRELHVHCYRMLGSLEDAEDLVQETILRAWRARESFEGRSSFRAWLYRIATNACLDLLRRRGPRLLPADVVAAGDPHAELPDAAEQLWLDPYPDTLIDRVPAREEDPESELIARETIELAFLAAIQHLTPSARAVLILRDVLGWSAKETAVALSLSVVSVNSSLQRARATLGKRLPARRLEWEGAASSGGERDLLRRYMSAHESGDMDALARLLSEDVRVSAPPRPVWYAGRDAFLASARRGAAPGRYRYVASAANGRPAAASYVQRNLGEPYVPLAIDVLGVRDGLVAELIVFLRPDLFPAFGLPATLD